MDKGKPATSSILTEQVLTGKQEALAKAEDQVVLFLTDKSTETHVSTW